MVRFGKITATAFASFAVLTAPFAANAEKADAQTPVAAAVELGPALGAVIPHDLSLADPAGAARTFSDLVGEKGMALFFVRSLSWCPFCKTQAKDVSEQFEAFEARGLSVVFVSYDTPAEQAKFAKKSDFKPALLSDKGSKAIAAFGLLNESVKDTRFYGIPHPAVFIVDTDKTVRAKFYEEDFLSNDKSYRNRPSVEIILDGVDAWLAAPAAH